MLTAVRKKRTLLLAVLLLICVLCLPGRAAAYAAPDDLAGRAAAAQQEIRSRQVGRYGMVPIYGRDVADGVYDVEVDSSSAFFRILSAQLIVEDHQMRARIVISSLSYLYVFPGTRAEAARAAESSYITYEEEDGHGVFTIPVAALDAEVECAAFSKKRQQWYDRQLVFYASSLPEEALSFDLPDYELIEAAIRAYDTEGAQPSAEGAQPSAEADTSTDADTASGGPEPAALALPDGEYSIAVNMTGGSGRASISSPTLLTVREGRAYARLLWSSTYYDYMIIEGEYFYNLTTDGGNSTFDIPITVLDEGMPVIADTTAMGDPVEIRYVLTFYEESIGAKGQIPQEAAKKVLYIAGAIIVVGGVINHFVKKKRK